MYSQLDPIWEEEKRALSCARPPQKPVPVGWPEFRRRPALDRSVTVGDTVVFSVDVAGHNNIINVQRVHGNLNINYEYHRRSTARSRLDEGWQTNSKII